MKCFLFAASATLFLLEAPLMCAQSTIKAVHWEGVYRADGGGNRVSLNVGTPETTTTPATESTPAIHRSIWMQTDEIPLSPINNYVVPEGLSGVFYGILQNTVYGGLAPKNISVMEITHQTGSNPPQSRFYIKNDTASEQSTIQGLIYFKKEDFLSDASDKQLSLGDGSSFTFSSTTTMPGGTRALRVAVYNDGLWYVSKHVFTNSTSFSQPYSNPSNDYWALWDPTGGFLPGIAQDDLSFSVLGSELTNIQAVGFTFAIGPGDAPYINNLSSFVAVLNAIPEGNSSAFLYFGSLIFFWRHVRGFSLNGAK